jgi:hypothetical protein
VATGWARKVGLALGAAARSGATSALREFRRAPSAPPVDTPAAALPEMVYAPKPDGRPDPGEIVWAWVPYEEDDGRGKDRPVLVVGRRGGDLLALMLTSKDHDRDEAQEAARGRYWCDIGTGDWDRERRPSEVRLDRLLTIAESAVRREGAVLDRKRFDRVAAQARRLRR